MRRAEKRSQGMTFRLKTTGGVQPYPRVVDDKTGIEVFEKYFREREAALLHDVGDFRHQIFIYRDPTYRSAQGIRDIEFYVRALVQESEKPPIYASGKVPKSDAVIPRGSRYLGFEIDIEEFDDTFREYAQGSQERMQEVRARVSDALVAIFANPKDKVVHFRRGMNQPRKRYALVHGIVQDVSGLGSMFPK
jgi:hypothetical protein